MSSHNSSTETESESGEREWIMERIQKGERNSEQLHGPTPIDTGITLSEISEVKAIASLREGVIYLGTLPTGHPKLGVSDSCSHFNADDKMLASTPNRSDVLLKPIGECASNIDQLEARGDLAAELGQIEKPAGYNEIPDSIPGWSLYVVPSIE
jgi:hypothetical protein